MHVEKIAFILGAGANKPLGFPLGDELKKLVAHEINTSRMGNPELNLQACRDILDCGVSIDRFLSENKRHSERFGTRKIISKVLLAHERKTLNSPLGDWLEYIWPSMISKKERLTRRFTFVTFNYDRSLEYRLARSCAALWAMDIDAACEMMDDYGVYHVYGSLGRLTDIPYGADDLFLQNSSDIKIIGEYEPTITTKVHERLADSQLIIFLGCHFHEENMALLALEKLPPLPNRLIRGSCFGMTAAERIAIQECFPYLTLERPEWDALRTLREMKDFQRIRFSK